MEKLTGNILSTLLSAISCQESLEAVLKIFIVNYPKYLKKHCADLRYQAIAVGLVEYKDYFEFELLVDECERKSYYSMMSRLYKKYQEAKSLAEELWYKNKIRSKFKQYVSNDKQFEELNEYFLEKHLSSSLKGLTALDDSDDMVDEEVNAIAKQITDTIEKEYFNSQEGIALELKSQPPATINETKTPQLKASKSATKKPTSKRQPLSSNKQQPRGF